MKKPSDRQILFARRISLYINKPLPAENTAQAYFVYIQENIEQYNKLIAEMRNEHKCRYHKTRKHIYNSVMDDGEDAEWAAAMDFSWM